MKRKEKYMWLFAVIYFSLFVLKKTEIYFPIVSDYTADLICIPLSLLFIEWLSEKLSKKKLEIGVVHVLIAVLYFSLVFEWWMPRVSSNYTSDFIDIICYFSGGIIYLLFFSKNLPSTQTV